MPVLLSIALLTTVASPGADPEALESGPSDASPRTYVWERVTARAAFPPSYNFPVIVARDGRFVALHPEGTWASRDGVRWLRTPLPWSGMNAAYLKYVQHDNATYALGSLTGNYERFSIEPLIRRTSDYRSWEAVGRSTTLPKLVFYAAASYKGKLWILGGYDAQRRETSEVWRSTDGLNWEKVLDRAPWSPRSGASAAVFRNRLYLIGGGRIDGPQANDVWSTADGRNWRRETDRISDQEVGGTPIVWDGRLWQIAANRTGRFSPAVLVSDDGKTWSRESAPWPARGAVAVWTANDSLYMTGGKYSEEVRGETTFTYYNDVWRLRRAQTRR